MKLSEVLQRPGPVTCPCTCSEELWAPGSISGCFWEVLPSLRWSWTRVGKRSVSERQRAGADSTGLHCHQGRRDPPVRSKQGLSNYSARQHLGYQCLLRGREQMPPWTFQLPCLPSRDTHHVQGNGEEEAEQNPACPLDLPHSPPATSARPSPRGWWLSACNTARQEWQSGLGARRPLPRRS